MRIHRPFTLLIIWALTQATFSLSAQPLIDLVKYVQPMAGTAASTTRATLKHSSGSEQFANTIPAVGTPFGMTQFTPQTRLTEKKCIPPYRYSDTLLSGFRGTHWLSGSCTQDYGSFTVMPISGKLISTPAEYATSFSHADEVSAPHYYRLRLPEYKLLTEITATPRAAMMQITMEQSDSLHLLITPNSDQAKGYVKIDRERQEISGYNPVHRIYQGWGEPAGFSGYFVIRFEKLIARSGTYQGGLLSNFDTISNKADIGAFVCFKMQKDEQLILRIGTSFSSIAGARKNLDTELAEMSFKELTEMNRLIWQKALEQIVVHTDSDREKKIFYTSFYHSLQQPRLFNDVDGIYPRFSGNYQLEKIEKGNYYDDFSMWDIYRAQLPLYQFLKPTLINDFVRSLILKGQQGRWLPIFPCWNSYTSAMIGDHVTAFIASSYTKNIRDYNVKEAYRLMRKNAFETADSADYHNGMGRRALDSYLKYYYIPMEDSVPVAFHKKEQVSRTLEYAYDDYALSVIAKDLGKQRDYKLLNKRASNFKNVFDASVGLMRGKYANGNWHQPFHPDKKEVYITEGTPRQYTFYVPHNPSALAQLMGGQLGLENALDTLFEKGEYWHGNEPGHQIPFMYNFTASPWKTQKIVRTILDEEYSDGPGGLSGNDDAGQMSAWYVFASIGFYPVDPVSTEYQLTSPRFDTIVINAGKKNMLTIISHKKNPASFYISKVQWNTQPHSLTKISHAKLASGGRLDIYLNERKEN